MAKIISEDIKNLGLTPELMGKTTDSDLTNLIDEVIAEQALLLEGRIGSTSYASTTSPTKDYIKRAEKCFVMAELIQIRINVILTNIVGSGQDIDITHEGAQRKQYLDEAEAYLGKVSGSVTTDSGGGYAGGVLITSHFDSTSSIGGLEEV